MTYQRLIESEYGQSPNNFHVSRDDDTLSVTLTYPNLGTPGAVQMVEINQESVRASDGIRVRYDYDRDGFVIEQPKPWARISEADPSFIDTGEDWIEVHFCQSWALGDPQEVLDQACADEQEKQG